MPDHHRISWTLKTIRGSIKFRPSRWPERKNINASAGHMANIWRANERWRCFIMPAEDRRPIEQVIRSRQARGGGIEPEKYPVARESRDSPSNWSWPTVYIRTRTTTATANPITRHRIKYSMMSPQAVIWPWRQQPLQLAALNLINRYMCSLVTSQRYFSLFPPSLPTPFLRESAVFDRRDGLFSSPFSSKISLKAWKHTLRLGLFVWNFGTSHVWDLKF